MAETVEDVEMDTQDIEQETPPDHVFIAPSIYKTDVLEGKSYSHFSPIPQQIAGDMSTECVLGVDEAGRLQAQWYTRYSISLFRFTTLSSPKRTTSMTRKSLHHKCDRI
jgi:hypothetical protein